MISGVWCALQALMGSLLRKRSKFSVVCSLAPVCCMTDFVFVVHGSLNAGAFVSSM